MNSLMACMVVLCLSCGFVLSQGTFCPRFHFLASDRIADGIHTGSAWASIDRTPDFRFSSSQEFAGGELPWVHQLRGVISEARFARGPRAISELSLILDRNPMITDCIDDIALRNLNEAIAREAADALRIIPGHGEYHRQNLLRAAADFDTARTFAAQVHHRSAFCDTRFRTFSALSQIGSPECVRILGEFVMDRDRLEVENFAPKGFGPTGSNASWAASALSKLPLRSNKPRYFDYESEEAWQLWYHEVKTGIRTFAFNDDPQNYNLDGPVSLSKDPPFRLPPKLPATPTHRPLEPGHLALALLVIISISSWSVYRYAAKLKS